MNGGEDVDQHPEILDRYMRALETADFAQLGEVFADDVLVEWPQSGEHFQGKETCINVFANYPGGPPKYLGLTRVTGSGDVWVTEASARYPDGKDYQIVGIFELRDGKIAHEVDYFAEPFPAPEWRLQYVKGS
jgi:ketosteroid isomerase-like protein